MKFEHGAQRTQSENKGHNAVIFVVRSVLCATLFLIWPATIKKISRQGGIIFAALFLIWHCVKQLLISEQKVQVSDTTDGDSSNVAGFIKIIFLKFGNINPTTFAPAFYSFFSQLYTFSTITQIPWKRFILYNML